MRNAKIMQSKWNVNEKKLQLLGHAMVQDIEGLRTKNYE
jgi:hypothetical protein